MIMEHARNRKKIAFIINPISGGKSKNNVLEQLRNIPSSDFDSELIFWEYPDQKQEIIHRIKQGRFDIAVAAGGDGTINQVAQAVMDTETTLGILPLGSGNGLARHLHIPLDTQKAIGLLRCGKEIKIDACFINTIFFLCTAGIGFDAHIGKLFSESKTRGFFTYIKLTLTEFMQYVPEEYKLFIDHKAIERKAFLVSFANASQYGNNAYIAPKADIQDGKLEVCILKPFKLRNIPGIAWRMFNKTLDQSVFLETYTAGSIRVERTKDAPAHYDGEPVTLGKDLELTIKPGAIKVLVPA